VDGVEELRLLGEVVPESVEMLVPVGIFDDDADAWVLLPCRAEHEVPARLAHPVDAIVGPAAIAPGGDVGVGLRGVEEEVVEDHFVEVACDQPDSALAFGAVGWVLIIEGTELPARAARRERDPARGLDASRLELAFDRLELCVSRNLPVAVGLDIDLVEMELRRNAGELARKRRRVCEAPGAAYWNVDRRSEMLVGSSFGSLRESRQPEDCQSRDEAPHARPLYVSGTIASPSAGASSGALAFAQAPVTGSAHSRAFSTAFRSRMRAST